MRKYVVIASFLITLVYACKHDVVNPPATGGSGGGGVILPPGTTAICFESEILPIFTSSCAKSGCHNTASAQDGYVLNNYANIIKKGIKPGNATGSKIYEVIMETDPGKRMPQPPAAPLTATQKDLIKRWINEGAKNTTNCSNTCDTTMFTYLAIVKPILDANCIGCHTGAGSPRNVDVSTYATTRVVALNGKLVGSISHAPGFIAMPQGAAKLIDCKIIQIRKWVQAGAPNN